jgi:hypothetical protein
VVDPIAVQAALLRAQAPELVIRPGQVLVARVLERREQHGLLSLAGATLVAKLPDEVPEGARLRLQVQDADGEQVVMRILADPPPATVPLQLPLPGDRQAELRIDDEDSGSSRGEQGEHISLVFDTPELGPLHLRLDLTQESVHARVQARAGMAYELATEEADSLRAALASVTGRNATVTIEPRREPLDVYA